MDFLEFIQSSHTIRKYGKERTPGGSPRHQFWFGVWDNERFVAYKFKTFLPIDQPPMCVITAFSLSDFVQTTKQVGLHITKAEREILVQGLGE